MLTLGYRHVHPVWEEAPASSGHVHAGWRGGLRRAQSAAAHSLLAALLQSQLGAEQPWQLVQGVDGRPRVSLPDNLAPIFVSLAHSHLLAICGVSDIGPIGIDVEYRRPRHRFSDIAAFAFGKAEQRLIEAGGRDTFYRIWVLREAYAKATGAGFPQLMDGRSYFGELPTDGTCQTEIDGISWIFSTASPIEDYAMAVAIGSDRRPELDMLKMNWQARLT
jgi:hypothetical protein